MSRPSPRKARGANRAGVARIYASGRGIGGKALLGIGVLGLAAAAGVALGGDRHPFGDNAREEPLPGVTLDDDGADAMPVVTSLRSGGGAERAGLAVGDHIAAVDGHRVRDVAAARATMRRDRAAGIDLSIVRDGAVRRVEYGRRDAARG